MYYSASVIGRKRNKNRMVLNSKLATLLYKKGRYRRLVVPAKSIVLVGDYFSASSRAVSMAL